MSGGIVLSKSTINSLATIDDIIILRDNINMVKQICRKLIEIADKVGLVINDENTEYIKLSRDYTEIQQGK